MKRRALLFGVGSLAAAAGCSGPGSVTRNMSFAPTSSQPLEIRTRETDFQVTDVSVSLSDQGRGPGWLPSETGLKAVLEDAVERAAGGFSGRRPVVLDVEVLGQRRETLQLSWMLRDPKTGLPLIDPQRVAVDTAADQDDTPTDLVAQALSRSMSAAGHQVQSRYGLSAN